MVPKSNLFQFVLVPPKHVRHLGQSLETAHADGDQLENEKTMNSTARVKFMHGKKAYQHAIRDIALSSQEKKRKSPYSRVSDSRARLLVQRDDHLGHVDENRLDQLGERSVWKERSMRG